MLTVLRERLAAIRTASRDETAAEATEVILVLVLLVIGLIAAWRVLQTKLSEKIGETCTTIDGAAGAGGAQGGCETTP